MAIKSSQGIVSLFVAISVLSLTSCTQHAITYEEATEQYHHRKPAKHQAPVKHHKQTKHHKNGKAEQNHVSHQKDSKVEQKQVNHQKAGKAEQKQVKPPKSGKVEQTPKIKSAQSVLESLNPFKQTKTDKQKRDQDITFSATERKAMQGDAKSQYALGYMYYHGVGAPRNKDLAMSWFKRAADKGQPAAIAAIKMINANKHPVALVQNKRKDAKTNLAQAKTKTKQPSVDVKTKAIETAATAVTATAAVATEREATVETTNTPVTSATATTPSVTPAEVAAELKQAKETNWAIRLGVFANENNINTLVKELNAAGYTTFTRQLTRNGKTLTSVFVGPHASKTDAQTTGTNIESKFKLKGTIIKNESV